MLMGVAAGAAAGKVVSEDLVGAWWSQAVTVLSAAGVGLALLQGAPQGALKL